MANKLSILVFCILVGCRHSEPGAKNITGTSVIINEGYRVKGNISNDTVYNGLMKFYDISTDRLVKQSEYNNNLPDGETTYFYENGQVLAIQNYSKGKRSGITKHYDSLGNLKVEENFYYDLRQGPVIKYQNSQVSRYLFLSCEEKALIDLDYQALREKKIPDVLTNFFFYSFNDFESIDEDSVNKKREYLIYIPNPPKYNFRYSLVEVSPDLQIKKEIQVFRQNEYWTHFEVFQKELSEKTLALRLLIDDPIEGEIQVYRKLK